jgi:hypothetical protein
VALFIPILTIQIFFIEGYELNRTGIVDFVTETIGLNTKSDSLVSLQDPENRTSCLIFLYETQALVSARVGRPNVVGRGYWGLVPLEIWVYGDARLSFFGGKLCRIQRLVTVDGQKVWHPQ